MKQVIFGPPGTGKTTHLLALIETLLESGTSPNEIAYVSFTCKAVNEARDRAAARFGVPPENFPWFRTIHSLCFRLLKMSPDGVMQRRDYKEVGDSLGVDFSGAWSLEEGIYAGRERGDALLMADTLARARRVPLETVWLEGFDDEDGEAVSLEELQNFSKALLGYKIKTGAADYTDMLERAVVAKPVVPVKYLFVDEAQDLSPLQWAVIRTVFAGVENYAVAGDDDQAIHAWNGADVSIFQNYPGERIVLDVTHRFGANLWDSACQIAEKIKARVHKTWRPRSGAANGDISWIANADGYKLSPGSWFLLARNGYMLNALEQIPYNRGVPYSVRGIPAIREREAAAIIGWTALTHGKHITAGQLRAVNYCRIDKISLGGLRAERELRAAAIKDAFGLVIIGPWFDALDAIPLDRRLYYRSVLANGHKLTDEPLVRIDTIHGVKGGEADNVLLLTDMTRKTKRAQERRPDDEHRVWYVGCTRARKQLVLVEPQTTTYYEA